MKKLITKLVLCSLAVLISICGTIGIIYYLCTNGENLTEDYNVYNAIKDITSTEELTETVSAMQVSYHIKHKKMTFEKYDSFSFTLNGNTCSINYDDNMLAFEKIDQGTDEKLDIKKTYGKDSTETYIQYRSYFDVYKKINNHYFHVDEIILSFLIAFIAADFYFILNLLSTIVNFIEQKDNLKYKKITVINTTED